MTVLANYFDDKAEIWRITYDQMDNWLTRHNVIDKIGLIKEFSV